MIMISTNDNQNYGPPPPITKLTHEQDFRLRQLEVMLPKDEVDKKDIITLLLALQKQNFVLCNSMMNLVENWPEQLDEPPIFISYLKR
tara:strand:- start:386 stop:649 length:264 start_codon:yes stop_codon:yes gene_type:complete